MKTIVVIIANAVRQQTNVFDCLPLDNRQQNYDHGKNNDNNNEDGKYNYNYNNNNQKAKKKNRTLFDRHPLQRRPCRPHWTGCWRGS